MTSPQKQVADLMGRCVTKDYSLRDTETGSYIFDVVIVNTAQVPEFAGTGHEGKADGIVE